MLIDFFRNSLCLEKLMFFVEMWRQFFRACVNRCSKNLAPQIPKKAILINKWNFEKSLIQVLSCALILMTAFRLEACTGMKLKAQDGSTVNGRTLEFGTPVDISIALIPRGYAFTGTTPDGPGLSYRSKYGAVGAISFGQLALMDGVNEKGLSAGTFYFPGYASYSTITKENQAQALSPVEFVHWILTQFATIDEIREALNEVVIAPTVAKEWGEAPAPFHYVVYEPSGKSLVIEPLDGKLVTYDNPLGAFTNSPTFDWHMTNLRNYINLRVDNVAERTIGGVALTPFGQGSGLVGLPGDFTPPSRFIRAALFSAAVNPVAGGEESVFQLFHLLNQFDIPRGVARQKVGQTTYSDYTMVTSVKDPKALKYYFKTYEDQTIHFVDLKKFDMDATGVKLLSPKTAQRAVELNGVVRKKEHMKDVE